MHDHFVTHKAAVHIGKLVVWARAGSVGQAGAAHHFERSGVVFDGDGLGHKLFTQHIGQALSQACRARVHAPLLHQLALVPDGKAHVGAGQGVAAHRLHAVRQLGVVAFQKLAASGGREEQLFDLHRGAHCAGGRADLAGAAIECKGGGLTVHAREQGELGHRIDGRQGFAPKAHGHDRFEVVQIADLAGGVAFQGGGQLVRRDAATVVLDGNQAGAATHQAQRDAACARVHGVVHQLAHHRGRALNHLACGDLADQFIGEFADGAARGSRGLLGSHCLILGLGQG